MVFSCPQNTYRKAGLLCLWHVLMFFPYAFSSVKKGGGAVFKINGRTIRYSEIYQKDPVNLYEIDKKKHEIIKKIAKKYYLEEFWKKKALKNKTTPAQARKNYIKLNGTITKSKVDEILNLAEESLKRKQDPLGIAGFSGEQRREIIRNYLKSQIGVELEEGILRAAESKGDLMITYPKPLEPKYSALLQLSDKDIFRYDSELGAKKEGNGCKGDSCLSIVSVDRFGCYYCAKVQETMKKVMKKYKGKVRWTSRDFFSLDPRSFDYRSTVAARCGGIKSPENYWKLYDAIFENQSQLRAIRTEEAKGNLATEKKVHDRELRKLAKSSGVHLASWEKCFENPPREMMENIRHDVELNHTGLNVSGTPAFFIGNSRLSGAQPFARFVEVIEEELKKRQVHKSKL